MLKPLTLPRIMGLICIAIGFYILGANIIKQLSWEKSTGIVLEVRENGERSNQFYPLAEWITARGDTVSTEILQSSNRFYYEEGDQIPVIYPQDNIKAAEINFIGWTLGVPLFFIVMGIIAILLPATGWYVSCILINHQTKNLHST